MRRLLDVLRHDGADGALAPPAGPRRTCRALAAQLTDAGLTVRLTVDGDVGAAALARALGLPDRAGGADQRAEARRAGPRRRAPSRYGAERSSVDVVDDGVGGADAGARRARARRDAGARALYGGELTAGPRPAGGFAVHAPAAAGQRVDVIRVLLADDQALVRAGFRMILTPSPTSTWSARRPTASRPSRWPAGCARTSC